MTDGEKAQERMRIANEAFAQVQALANQDRKLSHGKHISSHYSAALDQLDRERTGARAYLARFSTVGR